jgi:hypothetical protein
VYAWIKNNENIELYNEAEAIFETLPELNYFENLPLSCSDEFFFEGLVATVRTALMTAQADIHRERNILTKNMIAELSNLKQNYNTNLLRITDIERALAEQNETKLRDELENYKIFDRLNSEKLTPYFMKLARSQNKAECLSKVRGDRGEVLDEEGLEKHVTGFYADLYTKPRDQAQVNQNDLLNFLGPVQHEENVTRAKLNEGERQDLDRPLQINEFDRAIKQCNKKSAPGSDGISNRFIEHFWPYFRVPLFKYANCCFDRGELTPLFKTAKIRLIPKKGELKKISQLEAY